MTDLADARRTFDRDGFVTLPGLLSLQLIEALLRLIDPLMTADTGAGSKAEGRFQPHRELDRPTRICPDLLETEAYRRCHAAAVELIGGRASYVYDHAIYKPARSGAGTQWHQDEAYGSNGRHLPSVHFWIPFQDVNDTNGCLRFVPGSHKGGVLPHHRPAGTNTRMLIDVKEERSVSCHLRIGDVSVHHPRTLHAAGGNSSNDARRAWIVHFGPWGRLGKLHPGAILDRYVVSRRLT